jgi:hypothetical protein
MPIWHNFGRTLASRCNNCVRVRIMWQNSIAPPVTPNLQKLPYLWAV